MISSDKMDLGIITVTSYGSFENCCDAETLCTRFNFYDGGKVTRYRTLEDAQQLACCYIAKSLCS